MTSPALRSLRSLAKVSTVAVGGESRELNREDLPIPSLELLQGMTLTEFLSSGLVVVVRCSVLGDEVVWAADGTETALHGFDSMGRVIYRGPELRLLAMLTPEDLVAYHSLRKQVGEVTVESFGPAPPDEVKEEDPTKKKKKGAAA